MSADQSHMSPDDPISRANQSQSVLWRMLAALLVAYPLSLAPAQWWLTRTPSHVKQWTEIGAYTPIVFVAEHISEPLSDLIFRYADLLSGPRYRTRGGVI